VVVHAQFDADSVVGCCCGWCSRGCFCDVGVLTVDAQGGDVVVDISARSRIGINVAVEAAVTGGDVVPGSDLKVMLYLLIS
jgi:hypothetical protein